MEGQAWTYAHMDGLVQTVSARLRDLGLSAGDRVALLSTPRPEYLLLLMAISRAGGVYVGLNPRSTAPELAQVVQRVQPRLILALQHFEDRDFNTLLNLAAQQAPLPPVLHFDSVPRCLAAVAALGGLAPASAAPDAATAVALPDTAAIVFTSGTTGRPKAAMLTHTGLLHAATVQHDRLNPHQPRYLCNLPINHVGCLMNLTLGALVGGGGVVFQQRFAPGATLRLLRDEAITTWLQVPAMFHECVNHADFDASALSHLHSICIGGGAASLPTLQALRRTGAGLFVEYGQTETSSSASYSDPGADDEVLSHTIGRFEPRFRFRIADADDQACAVAATGEIQGRGALIFAGYFGEPEATRAAFTADGWLKTGDLACQRPDGHVELKGRLKEMIKSGGYNVYPREIECVLEQHPAVSQVVVVGLPDPRYGEAVHAVLTLHPGTCVSAAALTELCRGQLANYKVPKSWRLAPELALLPNGKVDRVHTREAATNLPLLP